MKSFAVVLIAAFVGVSSGMSVSPAAPHASLEQCGLLSSPRSQYDIVQEIIRHQRHTSRKEVRPTSATSPTAATALTIDYFVSKIVSVDEINGQFKVQLIFRQRWQDPRLAYADLSLPMLRNCSRDQLPGKVTVPESALKEFWTPDTFIKQELESTRHSLFHPNLYMRIEGNGNVLFSQRVTLTLACPDFASDKAEKECLMNIESYAHTAAEIAIDWKEEDPIYHYPDTFVPKGYKLSAATPLRCDEATPTSTYSCIQGKFTFTK